MSEQIQGAMVHELLGRFIEEAVERAVQGQMNKMAELAEKRAGEIVAEGAVKLNQTLERATSDIQKRIHQLFEQGLRTLTTEAERLVERNSQRVQEISQKALDDIPVTIQESLMQMTHENETLFHRRAEEWIGQFRAEQSAEMSLVLQAQFEAVRRSMLEEVAQSAKAICDRNLFDFRSDFENHVNRTFQHAAERLTAPFTRQ
jgi:exonuclease VII large subunit